MQALLLGSPAPSQKVWIIKSVQVQEGEKYNPTLLRSRCQDLWILKGKVYLLKFLGHFRHQPISFLARLEMARSQAGGEGRSPHSHSHQSWPLRPDRPVKVFGVQQEQQQPLPAPHPRSQAPHKACCVTPRPSPPALGCGAGVTRACSALSKWGFSRTRGWVTWPSETLSPAFQPLNLSVTLSEAALHQASFVLTSYTFPAQMH